VSSSSSSAAAILSNIELPSSVYLYVRACIVQGRLPICADSTSTSTRGVNGFASGKVANGTMITSGDLSATLAFAHTPNDVNGLAALTALSVGGIGGAGSASEGCTANWMSSSSSSTSTILPTTSSTSSSSSSSINHPIDSSSSSSAAAAFSSGVFSFR
jgi:hypothetical protein